MKKDNKNSIDKIPSGITRKDAIKKMGKYAALTAVGTFMILNPKKSTSTIYTSKPWKVVVINLLC